MNVSLQGAAATKAVGQPADPIRTFPVTFKAGETGTTISLDRGYPSRPVQLKLNGQTLPIIELDAEWVRIPRLPVGKYPATMVCKDGSTIDIILDVRKECRCA